MQNFAATYLRNNTQQEWLLSNSLNLMQLAEHLFRTESKKMMAVLTKIFGTENLQTAEDVVQERLLSALNTWKLKGTLKTQLHGYIMLQKIKPLTLFVAKTFAAI